MADGGPSKNSWLRPEGLWELREQRQVRDALGLALCEGPRFVARALEQGMTIAAVIVAPQLREGPAARRCLRALKGRAPQLRLTVEEFRRLSTMEQPTGLMAVVEQRWLGLPAQRPARGRLWLAAQRLRSPGNLGTIFRTAEAAGAAGFICLGDAIDPYHPRAVRASMGSLFGLRMVRASAGQLRAFKRCTGSVVVGATAEARRDYRRGTYGPAAVLMLGSERKGLSDVQRGLCDQLVRIPMAGPTDSLNVAAATSILLYESYRQRWPLGRGA